MRRNRCEVRVAVWVDAGDWPGSARAVLEGVDWALSQATLRRLAQRVAWGGLGRQNLQAWGFGDAS
jgi:hypothetical protein